MAGELDFLAQFLGNQQKLVGEVGAPNPFIENFITQLSSFGGNPFNINLGPQKKNIQSAFNQTGTNNQFLLSQLSKLLSPGGFESSFGGGAIDPQTQSLIDQQKGFISNLQPVGLSSQFGATLDELLGSGGAIDTSGIEAAARSAAERMFKEKSGALAEQGAAGFLGGTGSSAQTAAIARSLGDVSTRLGEEISRAKFGAAESAQQRRLAALNPALAQGNLTLLGRSQQAGAGQSLIDSLLSQSGKGSATGASVISSLLGALPTDFGSSLGAGQNLINALLGSNANLAGNQLLGLQSAGQFGLDKSQLGLEGSIAQANAGQQFLNSILSLFS